MKISLAITRPTFPKVEEHHKEEYNNLCEIVQAIEERDSAKAATLAEYHVFHFCPLLPQAALPIKKRRASNSGTSVERLMFGRVVSYEKK